MNKTHSHLAKIFAENHWPYFNLLRLKYQFKDSFDSDIKEMKEKVMIEPVRGMNGWLIKLIDTNTKWK